MRALTALAGAALILGACTAEETRRSGFGPTVRVCQGADCRDQASDVVTMQSAAELGAPRPDPDPYRGEDPAALRSAAEAGDARAAYLLGQVEQFGLAGNPRRPAEAARWYAQAAEAGNPWAQWRLAEMYQRGTGVRASPARARELTVAAAQGGQPQAAFNLGMMALEGRPPPRDPAEAARWLTTAAEGGVPEAQYNLGLLLLRGDGLPNDPYRGLTWLRRAAQAGHPAAQKTVGRIYMTGLDTMGQDLAEARTWLTPVAARGDRQAQGWLREVERAEREELAYQRELQLRWQETQAYVWGSIMAAMLAPPPVVIVQQGRGWRW